MRAGELREAAMWYAQHGVPVFPCHSITAAGVCSCGPAACASPGKHPRTLHGVADATTDLDRVRRWWEVFPEANIGGRCSSFIAVDVDPRHGGYESLAQLQGVHGELPYSVRQRTGGGGIHVLFRHPGFAGEVGVGRGGDANRAGTARETTGETPVPRVSVPSRSNAFGSKFPGLDVRGEGGYVLLAPSNHASGGVYEWYADGDIREAEIADAPAWLLELICAKGPGTSIPNPFPLRAGGRGSDVLAGVPEGGRDEALFRYACSLRARGFGQAEAEVLVVEAARRCAPPFDPGAAAEKVVRAWREYRPGYGGRRGGDGAPPYTVERAGSASLQARHWDTCESGDSRSGPGAEPPSPSPFLLGSGGRGTDFPFTDTGNAGMLVAMHGDRLRHVPEWGKWVCWENGVWKPDAGGDRFAVQAAIRVAQERLRQAKEAAGPTGEPDGSPMARLKWANGQQNRQRLEAMVAIGRSFPEVAAEPGRFDQADWLLNCTNGMVDLRTGELKPHDQAAYFTKQVPWPFEPGASCPGFERFLVQFARERMELVDCLLRFLGYCLTGSTQEQKWLMPLGPRGRNGKGVLFGVLEHVLGRDFCGPIDKRLLRASGADGAKFALAGTEGLRLVLANETQKRGRLDVEFIKEFVGGGTMTVERKGLDAYPARVRAKLIYAVNHFPEADFDDSFRSRTIVFPCDQSFYAKGEPEWQDGDLAPDKQLEEKLRSEAVGVLALLVKACRRYVERGLIVPADARAKIREYEEENDHFGAWLSERCVRADGARATVGELHKDFNGWAKGSGVRPWRSNEFRSRLDREGLPIVKPGNVRTVVGVRLVDGQASLEEAG